ncbi:MAG: ATP-binding cassette domain-containing protein [Bacteroidota bacterium]
MKAIEIENVTKTFGSLSAVDDLTLSVEEGSIYGFIGPNGSGKTTTLRMIMNIIYPDRGSIRLLGKASNGARLENVGYMPEERGLYKKMKVRELLLFYGELRGGRKVDAEVDGWLDRFDLASRAREKLETLSKGMSQKVQFIATIVPRPDLLILDEPFTGLDPVNADVIRAALLELHASGTTIILSTHDMHLAETLCNRICMIFRGKKVLDGSLDEIQERYGQDTVRLRTADGSSALRNLPGVEKILDLGQQQELRMVRDVDPQSVLKELVRRTRVLSFEITRPSLHDIFVRIAGPGAEEEKP